MNTLFFNIFLAAVSGVFLGINRVFLGKLGKYVSAYGASVINHIGGSLFLFPVVIFTSSLHISSLFSVPWYAYLGGVIGAFFTALTSFLIPRLGVMYSTVLFISGQIMSSVLFDYFLGSFRPSSKGIIGIFLIISGIIIGEYNKFHQPS